MEAAIIASAVLEDTIKKIAKKFNVDSEGALEEIIQRLTEAKVLSTVKKTRIQGLASLRNQAFHAEWDKFDIRDVGKTIEDVRELIDTFLAE